MKDLFKSRLIILLIMSLNGLVSFSQTTVSSTNSQTESSQPNSELHNQNRDEGKMAQLREDWNQALGTFQIQIVNSRINPQVDVSVIEKIENARKQDDIVYLPLMENVRILVLPQSTISSSRYEKLELFKYIQE